MLARICFAILLIIIGMAMLATAAVAEVADKNRKDIKTLQIRLEFLKIKVDALEEILVKEMAKNEDLRYRLIAIQNAYVRIKRDNENLAHRLMRGKTDEDSH